MISRESVDRAWRGPAVSRRVPGRTHARPSAGAGCETAGDQKLSALTTSPADLVPIAHQVFWLTLFLTNRTPPSAMRTFTPPECRLRIASIPVSAVWVQSACGEFGVVSIVVIGPWATRPAAQRQLRSLSWLLTALAAALHWVM